MDLDTKIQMNKITGLHKANFGLIFLAPEWNIPPARDFDLNLARK